MVSLPRSNASISLRLPCAAGGSACAAFLSRGLAPGARSSPQLRLFTVRTGHGSKHTHTGDHHIPSKLRGGSTGRRICPAHRKIASTARCQPARLDLPMLDALADRGGARRTLHCELRDSKRLRPCLKNGGSVIWLKLSPHASIVRGSSHVASCTNRPARKVLRSMGTISGSATNAVSLRHCEKKHRATTINASRHIGMNDSGPARYFHGRKREWQVFKARLQEATAAKRGGTIV